jgi:DeoR family fructose operon transcriptional repressor
MLGDNRMINSDGATNQGPQQRQATIYSLARQKGVIRVAELSELLGVTEMTIRRDLELLEKKGLIERTHGGAIYNDKIGLEPQFAQKSALRQAEKRAIGQLAASLIEEGDTIFVNSGSTTIEFLKQLNTPRVKVITNNPLAPIHINSETLSVILTGGEMRRESFTLVGELAIKAIKSVYANKAIIGIDGFSIKYGITNSTQAESWINRLMIMNTHGAVILVADSSKLGRVANFKTAPMSAVSILVTDSGMDTANVAEFERLGIKVMIAPQGIGAASEVSL